MDTGLSPAPSPVRQARAHHRHDLRTLTYVTLDQANGGVVRNLTHNGIGVQVVAALRPRQQLRVRFELRYPRLRVETRGEVVWSTFSGQCGIRFLDLSPRMTRQINEWIFGGLLEGASLHSEHAAPIFTESATGSAAESAASVDDGLLVSPASRKVIELRLEPAAVHDVDHQGVHKEDAEILTRDAVALDWLSRPLSSRGLAWMVNTLVVLAAWLLFASVFLSVTHEAPEWPATMATGATIVVGALYWGFFKAFGGSSAGARLARLRSAEEEDDEEICDDRFR